MSWADKPLVLLHGSVATPPFSAAARKEAGYLLRRLQQGKNVGMPHSRPMPTIGARCHEVFKKTTEITPHGVIDACQKRLRDYDDE